MKKNSDLISAKESVKSKAEKVIKSTEETAIKVASDVVKKENMEKTINAVKDTAKNVKAKATKAATVATTAAKKTIAKKVDVSFYVQYQGKEVSKHTILEKIHDEWVKSHKLSELKTLDVYLKVEDDTAYCLVNGKINIDLKLS
ncbi:DUF6465 family protein [Clostridium tagluense]|uniref:DUF6465 family protein n=1 Tax=Clostridium tagluense TaxID=360422 RepID=UPI001C6E5738|nr:DUF6465 family protein [Clostridium tagluense]MBW9156552.1 hypothetical protein [Clostridium tagluense]MCB2312513.1 DUF6465 family protein [Clostridium tagluense]MCB2317220.1 DUF6465 family protein [Clostridium tagluense]MCB2322084.1 DUF6465 family protein [Clostridium tagluense]MCB2327169.1 DUF6465 family protein [Clostridium tagluense]